MPDSTMIEDLQKNNSRSAKQKFDVIVSCLSALNKALVPSRSIIGDKTKEKLDLLNVALLDEIAKLVGIHGDKK